MESSEPYPKTKQVPTYVEDPVDNLKVTLILRVSEPTKIMEALEFADLKHTGQFRKCKRQLPYIVHPARVCQLLATVANQGANVHLLQAALLHDTVEDTNTTFEEIEAKFGPEVCELVREVTDDKSLPSVERKRLQVEHADKHSPDGALLKIADKIANLEDLICKDGEGIPVGWSVERIQQYCHWAKEVVMKAKTTPSVFDQHLKELFDPEIHFAYLDGTIHPVYPPPVALEVELTPSEKVISMSLRGETLAAIQYLEQCPEFPKKSDVLGLLRDELRMPGSLRGFEWLEFTVLLDQLSPYSVQKIKDLQHNKVGEQMSMKERCERALADTKQRMARSIALIEQATEQIQKATELIEKAQKEVDNAQKEIATREEQLAAIEVGMKG